MPPPKKTSTFFLNNSGQGFWGASAVSSPSGVWGTALADKRFSRILEAPDGLLKLVGGQVQGACPLKSAYVMADGATAKRSIV